MRKIRISLQKQFLGEKGEKQNAKNKRAGGGIRDQEKVRSEK
jgi:hypothetical protein